VFCLISFAALQNNIEKLRADACAESLLDKGIVNIGITFIKSVAIKLLVVLIVLEVLPVAIMLPLCGRITFKVCIVFELKLETKYRALLT